MRRTCPSGPISKRSRRRRDAETLLELMTRVTGESPRLWSSVIGFGQYHYKYASGREGDAPAVGFAPRRAAATSIYLPDGVGRYDEQLKQLGVHRTGVGCLYITDLDKIDLTVMEAIIAEWYRTVTADTRTRVQVAKDRLDTLGIASGRF
jgi:hypothetical protein